MQGPANAAKGDWRATLDALLQETDGNRRLLLAADVMVRFPQSSSGLTFAHVNTVVAATLMVNPGPRSTPAFNRSIACLETALSLFDQAEEHEESALTADTTGCFYLLRPHDDDGRNVERAISFFEKALELRSREETPTEWAVSQIHMAEALSLSRDGDRTANLRHAIERLESALEVLSVSETPQEWGDAMHQLAAVYLKQANLASAVDALRGALGARNKEEFPERWASTQHDLGDTLRRSGDIEGAIECCKLALEVFTRESHPDEWATILNTLGNAYGSLRTGDARENSERAISCFEQALEIRNDDERYARERAILRNNLAGILSRRAGPTRAADLRRAQALLASAHEAVSPEAAPDIWLTTTENLGWSYLNAPTTDPAGAAERAIACFEELATSSLLTPDERAVARDSLGQALVRRIRGRRSDNVEEAIKWLTAALDDRPRDAVPRDWAETQLHLVGALRRRVLGVRDANLERAIMLCREVLEVLDVASEPDLWGDTQNELGSLYLLRTSGSRAANVEAAVDCFEAALTVHAREWTPDRWATAQNGLGVALINRIDGDRGDNIERSIICLRKALEERTREVAPRDWAETLDNLASAYLRRVVGRRDDNVERALEALQSSLSVRSRDEAPLDRAHTMHNLGLAYYERSQGSTEENLERAAESLEEALEIFESADLPLDRAQTGVTLAAVYAARRGDDRAANLDRAIAETEASLEVFEQERLLLDAIAARNNLGLSYKNRILGDPGENEERAVALFERALADARGHHAIEYRRRLAVNLGGLHFERERWRRAAESYLEAIDAVEVGYASAVALGSKWAEISSVAGVHLRAAYSLAREGDVIRAVTTLERGRARALGETLARDRARLQDIEDSHPDVVTAFTKAAARLRELEATQRRAETGRPNPLGDALFDEELAAEMYGAQARLQESVREIRTIRGFEKFLQAPDFEELAGAALEEVPLAYTLTTTAGSLILLLIMVGDRVSVETVWAHDFRSEELGSLLDDRDGGESGYLAAQLGQGSMEAALRKSLPLLGEKLMAPLAARLQARELSAVSLVSCGLLGLLPLHAGSYEYEGRTVSFLQQFEVTFCPSARILMDARQGIDTVAQNRTLLGVANPLPTSRPLAYGRAELEEITARFEGRSQLLGEFKATKSALLEGASESALVHLACHGVYNVRVPEESYIELAQGDRLLLGEILSDRPFRGVRLVVASACQSAVIQLELADEAIGIPGGLLQAGVPGVVGTLWPVNDLTSALLMTRFYEYLFRPGADTGSAAMRPARALRQAQQWLAQASSASVREYLDTHPRLKEAIETAMAEGGGVGASRSTATTGDDVGDLTGPVHWAAYVFVGA